jgi:hypothetical protein
MSNIVPFSEMQSMAEAVAKSKLFGMTDPSQVLALMAVAQAEGLHPATAARDYHIIQGRPALKADAMLARFQAAGGRVDWKEYTDKKVTGVFTHPNGGSLELSWSIEQAQAIGLVKPGSGWQKFPRAMLRARVVSEGIRSVYPGCVIGTYTPEEVADFEPPKDMGRVEITMPKVEPVTIEAIAEDVPTSPYTLYLPDGKFYSGHDSADDYMSSYANLWGKIFHSQKISGEEKDKALANFKAANEVKVAGLDAAQRSTLTHLISIARGQQ